jgi:hypothetical protein
MPALACETCLPVIETYREPACCCAPSAGAAALTGDDAHRCGCDIAAAGTRPESADRAVRPFPAAPSTADADANVASPVRYAAEAAFRSVRLAMTPSPPGPGSHDTRSVLRI